MCGPYTEMLLSRDPSNFPELTTSDHEIDYFLCASLLYSSLLYYVHCGRHRAVWSATKTTKISSSRILDAVYLPHIYIINKWLVGGPSAGKGAIIIINFRLCVRR